VIGRDLVVVAIEGVIVDASVEVDDIVERPRADVAFPEAKGVAVVVMVVVLRLAEFVEGDCVWSYVC